MFDQLLTVNDEPIALAANSELLLTLPSDNAIGRRPPPMNRLLLRSAGNRDRSRAPIKRQLAVQGGRHRALTFPMTELSTRSSTATGPPVSVNDPKPSGAGEGD